MEGSTPLTRLPPEILRDIFLLVKIEHPPSIASFALTSKQLCSVADVDLFREFKIVIDREDFALSVATRRERLPRERALNNIRTLIVACSDGLQIADDNPDWQCVVELLDDLPGLTDFIFGCDKGKIQVQETSFPRTIFYALRTRHPRCRLHLHADPAWLNVLYEPAPDRYKLDLITSTSLHSLTLGYRDFLGYGSDRAPIYNEDELMFVLGLAPALREVTVSRHNLKKARWVHTLGAALSLPASKPAGPGFSKCILELASKTWHRAGLQRFHLGDRMLLQPDNFSSWMSRIDTSVLETLELRALVPSLPRFGGYPFPRLRNAFVQLGHPLGDFSHESWWGWHQILCQDNSLETLTIDDGLSQISWAQTLQSLGTHLTSLRLNTNEDGTTSSEVAEQLRIHCRLLEHLTITVKRTEGDRKEVQIYRDIGALPRLKTLSLTLDALNRTVLEDHAGITNNNNRSTIISDNDPSFDDFDQQKFPNTFNTWRWPRNGHVRQALVNSAFDKTLALAIFECISAGKPNGSGSRLLESLRVRFKWGPWLRSYRIGYRWLLDDIRKSH